MVLQTLVPLDSVTLGVLMLLLLVLLIILGLDIAFALFTVSVVWVVLAQVPLRTIPSRSFAGVNSFTLVAVPFFILAAELMNKANVTAILVQAANATIGRLTGGLAYANVISSFVFGGISGVALADASALGRVLIPAMADSGYDRSFSGAVTAWSSTLGPIVPPSVVIVIYGGLTGVSIGALFAASILPAVLLFLVMIASIRIMSFWYDYPSGGGKDLEVPTMFGIDPGKGRTVKYGMIVLATVLALTIPLIILGGIFGGIFTPSEAAAVASLYSLLLGIVVFRTIDIGGIVEATDTTLNISVQVFIIIAFTTVFSYIMAREGLIDMIIEVIRGVGLSGFWFMVVITVFLVFIGTWLEISAAIVMLAPSLHEIAVSLGVHPLQFGILMVVSILVGLITPPFGLVLFVVARVGDVELQSLYRSIIPFIVFNFVAMISIILFSELTLMIPRMLDYI